MSILVTGASGFIGSSVTDALVSNGADVVVLTRHALPKMEHVVQVTCDLGGHIDMTTLETIKEQPITAVVHCAAVTPLAKDADYSLDIQMAQNVVALARQLDVKRVVHISGWNVYDMSQSTAPYDEATTLKPDTDYGKSKLAVEALLREELGETVVSLRLASIYGPGQVSPGLITSLIACAANGETMIINAQHTRRDYLYIDDAAAAIAKVAHTDGALPPAINIGSGASVSVEGVATAISELLMELYGQNVKLSLAENMQESPISDNMLSIETAKQQGLTMLGATPFRRGLRTYIEWVHNAAIH